MLDYSEIRQRKIIVYEGEPAEVLDYHIARTQQRKPQNQVKLKSLYLEEPGMQLSMFLTRQKKQMSLKEKSNIFTTIKENSGSVTQKIQKTASLFWEI
jgi:hypothetical protein